MEPWSQTKIEMPLPVEIKTPARLVDQSARGSGDAGDGHHSVVFFLLLAEIPKRAEGCVQGLAKRVYFPVY